MSARRVVWEDRVGLRPAVYAFKGELVCCEREAISSADGTLVCELEHNGRGCTVDFLHFDVDGAGSIRSFSSRPCFDLRFRRIYTGFEREAKADVLAWVNERRDPVSGVDGGFVLALDEWGNEVAV